MTAFDRCNEHSGCLADIAQLKVDRDRMSQRMDAIMARLNVILGGIINTTLTFRHPDDTASMDGVPCFAPAGVAAQHYSVFVGVKNRTIQYVYNRGAFNATAIAVIRYAHT